MKSIETTLTDLDLSSILGLGFAIPKDVTLPLFSFEQVRKVALAQAETSCEKKDKILNTTIKSVQGQGPQHCARHPHFVDECSSCQNLVNENIDWGLFEMFQRLIEGGKK